MFKQGNIEYKNKKLCVLDWQTQESYQLKLLQQDYPIFYNNFEYPDMMSCYNAQIQDKKKRTMREKEDILIDIMIERFLQYPLILQKLVESNGVLFFMNCSHFSDYDYSDKVYWDGDGENSGYIRCCIHSYLYML